MVAGFKHALGSQLS
jgi:hypothetical protein